MKKIENQTIYKCEHCGKISVSAGAMTIHEIACKMNPLNHPECVTCKLLNKKVTYVNKKVFDPHIDDFVNTAKKQTEFICMKDNAKMYHNKINRFSKERIEEIKSKCDRPMKMKCEDYMQDFKIEGLIRKD